MPQKLELGQKGEEIASQYLLKEKYKILCRNFREKWGELDIVAVAPDKTLVFVEVKTMRVDSGGLTPEDQMTQSKLRKFKRTASLYAGSHPELINDKRGWRLDVIAILVHSNKFSLKHYENV